MEFIFHNHNHLPGCILKNVTDKPLIRSLVEALHREMASHKPKQDEVIAQLINTVITISARNIILQGSTTSLPSPTNASMSLITYIQDHIYQPEALRIESLAAHFHVAKSYVSEYFRKHSGESLQQYIINYKLKLMETRLLYTDMRINEIASEFGFTDESHLNRIFKKYKKQSPTAFRKLGKMTV